MNEVVLMESIGAVGTPAEEKVMGYGGVNYDCGDTLLPNPNEITGSLD